MAGRLLLVDDDRFILNALARLLGTNGFHCTQAVTADEAWRALDSEEFDLMLLDIGLPDLDGVSLCRRVRARHRLPIIMLTARDASADKVIGLEVGADDYITKPFESHEVLARVRAHIRRNTEYSAARREAERIAVGSLIVDVDAHDAVCNGRPAGLTDKEFELLHVLARNFGRALERDWLFEQVWGYDADLGVKTLAVYVRRLRCKIEADPEHPRYLVTMRGFGYKLVSPDGG